MDIVRHLNLKDKLSKKSLLLLGPRQTGKSFLIKQQLSQYKSYNLLKKEDFTKLSFNPSIIRKELKESDKYVIIDEIQKLPELLDEVQYMIDEFGIKFLLTGSSARKLKKQNINLLGGRARTTYFHPLVSAELKKHFDLTKAINFGLIPSIYFSDDPNADLQSYIETYLQQEIANEGLVRSLPAFSRFLEVAALCHGEQIDFTSISNDAQVPRTTIHEYFSILEDTLVGHKLSVWSESKKRKPIATPKFYFFDWGVVKALLGINSKINEKSETFGKAFESLLFHELKTYTDYNNLLPLTYWRTQSQHEVDFILNEHTAIEVKSTQNYNGSLVKNLKKLQEEKSEIKNFCLVYRGPTLRFNKAENIRVLNVSDFLKSLWTGEWD